MIKVGRISRGNTKKLFLVVMLWFFSGLVHLSAQATERPFIWVKKGEREAILNKIEEYPVVASYYQDFMATTSKALASYQNNRKEYLYKLPFDWNKEEIGKIPPFLAFEKPQGQKGNTQDALVEYLRRAVDAGVLYYLTEDKKYAEYSGAILYSVMHGLLQIEPSENAFNGGWLYTNDHLREARILGAQLPIIYDFIHPYLTQGNQVFDFATGKMTTLKTSDAEAVFRTYIKLALEHGIIDCNWPILESASLVGNIMALDDTEERESMLRYFLRENTERQDALQKISDYFLEHEGIWPESLNYADGVSHYLTYLITLLSKYDFELRLGRKHQHILKSLGNSYAMTFPNRTETVLMGDGHREYEPNYFGYETAYYLATLENLENLKNTFGSLLTTAMRTEDYKRFKREKTTGTVFYNEPLRLLWFAPEIEGDVQEYPLPVTDALPFAGIVLQRNLSETKRPEDAFMSFVGGGHYVHGHATGMFMELYGKGFVLGSKAGRGRYRTELHENYYRLFASNNTVIVNGESQSEGGWANLKINTVRPVVMEPKPKEKNISPNHSFTVTSFRDDLGEKAEATQERTMGIVRTSPTTGFYVDVFRSKSALPNEFHDYIYHNVGESLELNLENSPLPLKADPERFSNSESKPWANNKVARHPGWHYFEAIETSEATTDNVTARFQAKNLGSEAIGMNAFMVGNKNREYTKALAPPTTEGPKPYRSEPTPTLVVRQKGETWSNPFAVLYEPTKGKSSHIKSVKALEAEGKFKGFKVIGNNNEKAVKHFILVLSGDEEAFVDTSEAIAFTGRYAVITVDNSDNLISAYIGHGAKLRYKNLSISTNSGKAAAVYISVKNGAFEVQCSEAITIAREGQKTKIYESTDNE
ncbi:hypothetical protein FGM00_05320 [Aggregatimonas sangjinii]|uniref:Heparinase II/III-like protein n=1 Tax=Aggregatimonas sangjinii TaxID=2583587 RepID=A0A5B7SSB9_9FLAO|nr:hypothetical protein [Aggregatimonas sangjinii]QCW99553.1 hypothetical protein FGM00_05320 [Aggregatimonas sangjinii]